jgi:hypothetical protein
MLGLFILAFLLCGIIVCAVVGSASDGVALLVIVGLMAAGAALFFVNDSAIPFYVGPATTVAFAIWISVPLAAMVAVAVRSRAVQKK